MGKVILCSGVRSSRPYLFSTLGIRVYSIEELCYVIYHNIYFLDVDLFSHSLVEWIGEELKLIETADKIKRLKHNKSDLKTMVTVILCSADYYTEQEIKALLREIDELSSMTPLKRHCYRAKSFLKNKQYKEAASEYEHILNSDEVRGISPEEYGDMLHNFAVAIVHWKGLYEARDLFWEAYQRNQKKESLFQYLLLLKQLDEEAYVEKVAELTLDPEEEQMIQEKQAFINKEVFRSEEMKQIRKLKRLKKENKFYEYRMMQEELIFSWMEQYRKEV